MELALTLRRRQALKTGRRVVATSFFFCSSPSRVEVQCADPGVIKLTLSVRVCQGRTE